MNSPIVQQADDKAREVDQKVQEFFSTVNDVLSWVPSIFSDLIEPIEKGMEYLRQKMQEFWDRVKQLFQQPGSPDRLHQVAEEWVGKVGNVIGDIGGTIGLDKMQTNLDWQGRGAEAFKATVPAQVSGLNAVKDLANQLRGSLDNLGNGIESFWTAVVAALIAFAVGIIAAILGAMSVVGTPAGIAAVLAAVGVALALITTAVTSMQSLTNTISGEQNTIAQKVHDLGTDWAKSNIAAMQEKSDWHVMT